MGPHGREALYKRANYKRNGLTEAWNYRTIEQAIKVGSVPTKGDKHVTIEQAIKVASPQGQASTDQRETSTEQ